jgi:hypothetical protein
MPLLLRQHFGTPLAPLLAAAGGPLLLGVPYALALGILVRMLPPSGWPGLALAMATTAALFAILSWWIVLTAADRREWRARLRGVLGRPPAVEDGG